MVTMAFWPSLAGGYKFCMCQFTLKLISCLFTLKLISGPRHRNCKFYNICKLWSLCNCLMCKICSDKADFTKKCGAKHLPFLNQLCLASKVKLTLWNCQ